MLSYTFIWSYVFISQPTPNIATKHFSRDRDFGQVKWIACCGILLYIEIIKCYMASFNINTFILLQITEYGLFIDFDKWH